MNDKFFMRVAPLVKNMEAWNAFVALIEHEIDKSLSKLRGKPNSEEALRISAEYSLLNRLLDRQKLILDAEKN